MAKIMQDNNKRRKNLISLYHRKGYQYVPVQFHLCPALLKKYESLIPCGIGMGEYFDYPEGFCIQSALELNRINIEAINWGQFYDYNLSEGTYFDDYGVAHEPGSKAAEHMTRMHHPMTKFDSLEQFQAYPWPQWDWNNIEYIQADIQNKKSSDFIVVASMQCTIWETSWYLRGMPELMMDMLTEDNKASFLLDKITDISCKRAAAYAQAGADVIFLGDDVGMQSKIMMSSEMFRDWLKPRLQKVCRTIKQINPDCLIQYHSCGFITPLIGDLIETGVEILDPIQPECMDFAAIHEQFGDKLSFHGTIGTQTTMPFASSEEVKRLVWKNLDIAGSEGGLFPCPTHLLEPEVPWENIEAYVLACKEYCI